MIRRPPRRADQPELLDSKGISQEELDQNLADIALFNRLTSTTGRLIHEVAKLLVTADTRHWRILDLGTGAGDFSSALAHWSQRRRLPLSIIAADLRSDVLNYAKRRLVLHDSAHFCQLNGMSLPLADRSIDIAVCSQTAHHLEPESLQKMLLEMQRVSRIGFVLLDLDRGQLAHHAIWLLTHIGSRNRLTRYDGPLSAQRAYTQAEILDLAQRVGLELSIRPIIPFRWLATWQRKA